MRKIRLNKKMLFFIKGARIPKIERSTPIDEGRSVYASPLFEGQVISCIINPSEIPIFTSRDFLNIFSKCPAYPLILLRRKE